VETVYKTGVKLTQDVFVGFSVYLYIFYTLIN